MRTTSPPIRLLLPLAAALALLYGMAAPAAAAVRPLNHEGLLLDEQGLPMTGSLRLTFRLWTLQAGGQKVWEEVHDVELLDGYYQVLLGSINPLDLLAFQQNASLWLGIVVGVGGSELSPRHPLGAVGYALVAEDARGDIHPRSVFIGQSKVIDEQGRWVGNASGLTGPAGPAGASCYDGLGDRNGDGSVTVADCLGGIGP
ncbi:MAG: hypothetical protein FJ125_00340 [Deltaproteobacteria bacterium]|nr:hypothetical protein [Deltaproteobacteria bacterium]